MDGRNTSKRAYAARNSFDSSEVIIELDKMEGHSVVGLSSRESRTDADAKASITNLEIPSVDDLEREMLAASDPSVGEAQQPQARARQPHPGSDITIETKKPAPRDSAKHRFDELKINFLARYGAAAVKSILFVGTSRGDGASTAAYSFAQSLAQDLDVRVLFIAADLRVAPPAENKTHSGLSNLAKSADQLPLPALHGNVHVLPSGHNYADPAVLFQSKRFQSFMAHVSKQYDYIVIDGPPLDEAPESVALCTRVDGVILVVDAQRTRRKIALRAKTRVQEVGGKLIGMVLNRRKYYVPGWLYKLI